MLGEETSPGDIAGILTRMKGVLPGDRFSMEINTVLKPEPLRPALSSLLKLGCCGAGFLTGGGGEETDGHTLVHILPFCSFGHANHAFLSWIYIPGKASILLAFRTKNGLCLFNIVII